MTSGTLEEVHDVKFDETNGSEEEDENLNDVRSTQLANAKKNMDIGDLRPTAMTSNVVGDCTFPIRPVGTSWIARVHCQPPSAGESALVIPLAHVSSPCAHARPCIRATSLAPWLLGH